MVLAWEARSGRLSTVVPKRGSTVTPSQLRTDAGVDTAIFRLLLEGVKDYAILMLDPEGRIVTWNQGAENLHGYPSEEIIGEHLSRFYPREEVLAAKPDLALKVASETGRYEEEGFRVRKDGSLFWANAVVTTLREDSGALLGFALVTRDLTEQRAADERLRQAEERIRLMVTAVKDYAIFMLDQDGYISSWNLGAQRLKGYTAAEVIGKHFSMFYTEEDVRSGKAERELEAAARMGRVEDEGWRVRKDGSRFWANVVLSAVRDSTGKLRGFAKVTRDTTERMRAQEQLKARAQQSSAVADLGLHALQTPDLQPVLQRAAEAAASILGTELAVAMELEPDGTSLRVTAGVGLQEGLVGTARVPVKGTLSGLVLETREPAVTFDITREKRFRPAELWLTHGAVSGAVVLIPTPEADQPFGTFGVYATTKRAYSEDDIRFLQALANVVATAIARRKTEERLRAVEHAAEQERLRVTQAERALRERDDFLSVAAHELRTPLTAMRLQLQGLSHALDRGEMGLPGVPPRLHRALKHTDRMGILVERLLDVSRIAAGQMTLHREPLDLVKLVREIVDDLSDQAANAGSEVRLDLRAQPVGDWDRVRLEQVVMNLLTNALKYGAGKPIDVTVDVEGDLAHLVVKDQGIGIQPEDLGRIFRRFERAAPSSHFAGMGLGLYIAGHIVDAHGGTVHVESAPGAGATFRVTLPLRPPAGPPPKR